MGSIVLLDENTINKIAAGEVVDRPSSIIKELVENSIDAGASNIAVEIKNGGIGYIKVQDDGIGFKADDIEIAFERHATSKIRKESDILTITSMGFRGEALASIAAISKVTLVSKHKEETTGSKIIVEGGTIISLEKSASTQGTTILIRDVFYNTPARFKFLKKDYTEAGYIEEVMIRIAMANPSIAVKYTNNGKLILNTNGDGKLSSTVYAIFGKETYENILDLDYEYQGMKVTGVIGKSVIARGTRTNEYAYINTRFVKDKTMIAAIEKAYTEKLGINKFPFVIINLTISPETIDVNVHPAKLEVKFENEGKVFEAIYFAIKDRLERENKDSNPFTILNQMNTVESKKMSIGNDQIVSPIHKQVENNIQQAVSFLKQVTVMPKQQEESQEKIVPKQQEKLEESKIEYFTQEQQRSFDLPNVEIIKESEEKNTNIEKINYQYVGNAFSTYIIIQIQDNLYMIDQHAAHERLIFERFKKHFYSKEKETQMLMIPMLIDLKNSEMQVIKENMPYFEQCGYLLEQFSDNSIKISGIPNIADVHLDDKSIFLGMVDELLGEMKTQYREKEFRFLATVACKAAVKGNMDLSKQEQISLLNEMLSLENPFTCPHGRQIAYTISKSELEKKVNRR